MTKRYSIRSNDKTEQKSTNRALKIEMMHKAGLPESQAINQFKTQDDAQRWLDHKRWSKTHKVMSLPVPATGLPTDGGMMCFFDSARGVHIPRDFINSIDPDYWQPINDDDRNDLSNFENDHYWDTWQTILDTQFVTDEKGNKWQLYQDGDLFLVCFDLLTDEEREAHFNE